MVKILVVYHSVTGNTARLAQAVAEGAGRVAQVELRRVDEVSNDDLLMADGIIVGSPTYFGQMSAEIKALFDASNTVYGRLDGKVGAAFTTTGAAGCGTETTLLSILTAMLIAGMVVRGYSTGGVPCLGAFAIGAPAADALGSAREMGARIAALTRQLDG